MAKKAAKKEEKKVKRLYELCPCKYCGYNPPVLRRVAGEGYMCFCEHREDAANAHSVMLVNKDKEKLIRDWNILNENADYKPSYKVITESQADSEKSNYILATKDQDE